MAKRVHRRLSEREITGAKPPKAGRLRRLADGGGLYLVVSKNGARWWTFRCQMAGRLKELGLGSLEEVDSETARDGAAKARKLVRNGRDPVVEMGVRAAAKRAPSTTGSTFKEVALDTITAKTPEWSNGKTAPQWKASLEAYAFPAIGAKPVAEVTVHDVYALLEPVWVAKPETARRVRRRIEAVLDRAKVLGLRDGENPARLRGNLAHLLAKQRGDGANFAALPFKDAGAFMAALRQREGVAARALELQILTAARPGEVLGARWDEFDLEAKVWTVPAGRMKMGKEHRVPLSDAAVKLLRAVPVPEGEGNPFVFVSPTRPGGPLSDNAFLALLKKRMGVPVTAHGFRSTFRDWAAEETSFPNHVIEKALAHAVKGVEGAYRRGDLLDKRRRLMDAWAGYLAKAREEPARKDNVRPIRQRETAAA